MARILLLLAGFALCLVYCCEAYDFYVGGRNGWSPKPAEKYNSWAEKMRYQVNDKLVFKYKKGEDSVLLVKKEDFDSCNTKNPIAKFEDGNSVFTFDRSGPFFFISGAPGHCAQGQKLIVVVLAVRNKPVAPPSSPITPPPSVTPSTAPISKPPSSSVSPVPASPTPAPVAKPPGYSPAPTVKPSSPSPSPSSVIKPPSSSPSPAPATNRPSSSPSPSPAAKPPSSSPARSPSTSPVSSPVQSPSESISPSSSPPPASSSPATPSTGPAASEVSPPPPATPGGGNGTGVPSALTPSSSSTPKPSSAHSLSVLRLSSYGILLFLGAVVVC